MDEEQIEIKKELGDEHKELQIKNEPNDQEIILSPIENPNLRNCDKIIQRAGLNKSETITILSYSKSKPSDGRTPSQKLINLTFKNVQEKRTKKCEVNSQKLIKTFVQTDQGVVLIGKRGCICRFCGDEFNEEKDMNKHIILDHKGQLISE